MEIWIPKTGRTYSRENVETVWDAWRNDSPKDECRVHLEGPEKEWSAGTDLGLLRVYQFPGHVTTSDGSVGTGSMDVILRHTPDHEDLITSTDSEVLCRLVGRWVGQGGKVSLVNTVDADILEYILAKLTSRIETQTRTFLVKVKAHRKSP